jgi:hypothetical protein
MKRTTIWFLSILLLAYAGTPRFSVAASFAEEASGIVKGKTKAGFYYISGGFGTDERELMLQWSNGYNLKLSFAERSGAYLADVDLTIKDEKGNEVIASRLHGPWFYIQLPSGRYSVEATFKGVTKQIKNLRLPPGERASRVLHWELP